MIRSMTAFASASDTQDWGTLSWELRSVNHRYLDINLRLPDELRAIEMAVRDRMAAKVSRGKLDGILRFRPNAASSAKLLVNDDMARAVIDACQIVNKKLHQPSEMNPMDILRWPGVVTESERDMQSVQHTALNLLDKTLGEFTACRQREGERLQQLIQQRCSTMIELVKQEKIRRPQIAQLCRDKMQTRINELKVNVDKDRFEQELAYLLQKMDVDEELDRLQSHFVELQAILKRDEAVGRRLDFIMQELNREANTLGSKSVDMQTTQLSVELKVLIEQMREQIQNIE